MRVSYKAKPEQSKKNYVHKKVVDRLVESRLKDIKPSVELAQVEDDRIPVFQKRDKLQKLTICALVLYPLLEFILRHGN